MRPDIEAIVGSYLRTNPDIEAIVGGRVVGRTPADDSEPWVRVFELPSVSPGRSTVDWHVAYYLQLDCFAGTNARGRRGDSKRLALAVCAAVDAIDEAELSGGVVSGSKVESCRRLPPDADFDPAMERYMVTATIWAHPTEEGS